MTQPNPSIESQPVKVSDSKIYQAITQKECERDGIYFSRYFFKHTFMTKMIVNRHHELMQTALDRTMLPHDDPQYINRLIINIPPGYTKCSVKGTILCNQEGYTMIENINVGDEVQSYDRCYGQLTSRLVTAKEEFEKQCVKVSLKSGRELKLSHDHPVLTQRGWVNAEDLTIDHYLIRLCTPDDGSYVMPEAELTFITLMLFEGGCSSEKNLRFTSADEGIVEMFLNACDSLDIEVKQYPSNQSIDYNLMGGVNGVAATLLRNHGILGCLAKDKQLPAILPHLNLLQKYKFIGLMLATDGFVTANHGQLGVTLASPHLVHQISMLLDSCGVPNMQYYQDNDHAGAWTVMIPATHSRELYEHINLHHKSERFEATMSKPTMNDFMFGYPYDVVEGNTYKCGKVRPKINIKRKGALITPYLFNRIKTEVDPSLSRYEMDDFIYDRVKHVEDIGQQTVYHLSVDADDYNDKNYLANNLVVHNTEMAVINYAARGLALNPQSRYLHLSYSSNLAMQNSSRVREVVKSRPYQTMWPIAIKEDADSKSLWWTDSYGGMYATAAGAQVTGFRAGHMDTSRFTGALIVDDPTKPDDANFEVRREAINTRYNETIKSRLAVESVPIIVIMQRVHHNDLSGYLLRGGSGEKWHHLNLPVEIDHTDTYPEEYTHGIPLPHDLPDGWLWPFKHNDKHATSLRSHRRTYRAQYMQDPIKQDEAFILWTPELIAQAKAYQPDAPIARTVVAVDPAVSNRDNSDHHGIVVASSHVGYSDYTVHADYTCKGSPKTWADKAIEAYNEHDADAIVIETNQGGDMCEETLRNAEFKGRVIRVHASKGKAIRAEPIAALYEQGMVRHDPGLSRLEDELEDFDTSTGKSNDKSPNRLDAMVWALTELSTGVEMSRLLKLVVGGNN